MIYYRVMITTGHQGWLVILCSPPWPGSWCSCYVSVAPTCAVEETLLHSGMLHPQLVWSRLTRNSWDSRTGPGMVEGLCGGMHNHILCPKDVKFLIFTFLFFYLNLPVNDIPDLTDTWDLKAVQFWQNKWNCWPKTMKRSLYVCSKRERQECQYVLYLTSVSQHWKPSPSLGFSIKTSFASRETPWGKDRKKSTCTKMLHGWAKAFSTINSQGLKTASLIR